MSIPTATAAAALERGQPCPREPTPAEKRADKAVRAPAALNHLPPDWNNFAIREVTVRTKQRDPRRHPTTRFRYVDVSSVSNSSFRIVEATEVEGSAAPSRARKEIRTGDVLFATVRPTLKRVALVPLEFDGQIASTGFIVLRADPEKLHSRYLYGRLLTDAFTKRMGELERGASYPAVRDGDVLSEIIPVPPLAEQRKIAAVLGLVQRAMEQQERLVALTTELKKALLHQLFTQGLRGEPEKQTEIGPVPRSWEARRLGDYARVVNGYAFKSDDYVEMGVRLIRISNVGVGTLMAKDDKYLPPTYLRDKSEYALEEGDLILALTRPIIAEGIKFCFVRKLDIPALLNQRVGKFQITSPKLLKDYLSHVLFSDYFIKPLRTMAEGSNQPNISPTRLENFLIPIPTDLKEQAEIAEALTSITKKAETAQRKHAALTALFRTLLHQLMTAQIRVGDLSPDNL